MAQAEQNVSMIQDPVTYYRWLSLLSSESRALDFPDKWEDSLRAVNAPTRLGSPGQLQSDRWFDALAQHPNPKSDVWNIVRDWDEFQRYIQAAVAIFESPLYEGRPGNQASMKREPWYREAVDRSLQEARELAIHAPQDADAWRRYYDLTGRSEVILPFVHDLADHAPDEIIREFRQKGNFVQTLFRDKPMGSFTERDAKTYRKLLNEDVEGKIPVRISPVRGPGMTITPVNQDVARLFAIEQKLNGGPGHLDVFFQSPEDFQSIIDGYTDVNDPDAWGAQYRANMDAWDLRGLYGYRKG